MQFFCGCLHVGDGFERQRNKSSMLSFSLLLNKVHFFERIQLYQKFKNHDSEM